MSDKNIPIHDPNFSERTSGLASGVSYHGLEDLLRRTGYLKDDEQIAGFRVTDYNLTYYIEKKEEDDVT